MAKTSFTKEKSDDKSSAIARINPASDALTIGGVTVGVKQVTVPTLSQKGDTAVAFIVTSKMEVSSRDVKVAGQQNGRAVLLKCIDLADGITKQYVVPTIMRSELEPTLDVNTLEPLPEGDASPGEYSGGAYVGKAFLVQKGIKPEGKRYRELQILELDIDGVCRGVANMMGKTFVNPGTGEAYEPDTKTE